MPHRFEWHDKRAPPESLVKLARSDNWMTRRSAAGSLPTYKNSKAFAELKKLTFDANGEVRAEAVEGLHLVQSEGNLSHLKPEAAKTVIRLLSDEHSSVRLRAASVLPSYLDHEGVTDHLLDAIAKEIPKKNDVSFDPFVYMMKALAKIPSAEDREHAARKIVAFGLTEPSMPAHRTAWGLSVLTVLNPFLALVQARKQLAGVKKSTFKGKRARSPSMHDHIQQSINTVQKIACASDLATKKHLLI